MCITTNDDTPLIFSTKDDTTDLFDSVRHAFRQTQSSQIAEFPEENQTMSQEFPFLRLTHCVSIVWENKSRKSSSTYPILSLASLKNKPPAAQIDCITASSIPERFSSTYQPRVSLIRLFSYLMSLSRLENELMINIYVAFQCRKSSNTEHGNTIQSEHGSLE